MSQNKGIGGHHSHNMLKDEWLTPPDIIEALGPFDLDPCSPKTPPWPTAAKQYSLADDGLTQEWDGFVWCNPPYGRECVLWLNRLADHGNGIALIFARTETAMFFEEVWKHASAMLFIEGRLHFHHVDGSRAAANSGAPSVLVGYGPEAKRRLESCNISGALVTAWHTKTG
jgi:hypothetical protein